MATDPNGVLEVKYGGLDAAATQLVTEAKLLEEALDAIQRAVTRAAEGWEGEAFNVYTQVQASWDKDAKAIHAAIASIAKVVHSAGGDYRGGDLKAASYYHM